jgi:hypothetical protein
MSSDHKIFTDPRGGIFTVCRGFCGAIVDYVDSFISPSTAWPPVERTPKTADGRHGGMAYVFYSRIERAVRTSQSSFLGTPRLHQILGCAIVHEIRTPVTAGNLSCGVGNHALSVGTDDFLRVKSE